MQQLEPIKIEGQKFFLKNPDNPSYDGLFLEELGEGVFLCPMDITYKKYLSFPEDWYLINNSPKGMMELIIPEDFQFPIQKIEYWLYEPKDFWNKPWTELKNTSIKQGLAPYFNGGCMGILPNESQYIFLGEDDDHYWEVTKLTKSQLEDYLKALKQEPQDSFQVEIKPRESDPQYSSIYIKGCGIDEYFDVSWIPYRVKLIEALLTY